MTESFCLSVPPRTAYLSAADRQTEAFVERNRRQSSFEASLLQNVLFESAVLIPDVFYFISSGLADHIANRAQGNMSSLLEAGVAAGAVIPAFRDPGITNFKESYELIKAQDIRGLLEEDACRKIARNLDLAVQDGQEAGRYRYTSWPSISVGAMFERRLKDFFQPITSDAPPIDNPAILELWDRTQHWRRECLDEARAIGAAGTGFKRGDYMAAIGRSLGLPGPIDDIGQLFGFAGLANEDSKALRALCLWMNECYQYNQARAFGADPSWARFRPDLSLVTLAAMEGFDRESPSAPQLIETTVTARVPPPRVLLEMDAKELLDIRTERAGRLYFAALDEWRTRPFDDVATRAVNEEFKNYARVLREKAAKQGRYTETPLRQRLVRWDGPSRSLALAGAAAIGSLATLETQYFAPFVALGGLGFAAYLWGTERSQRVHHTLRASIEMNLPS